jgi:hypothetical protein
MGMLNDTAKSVITKEAETPSVKVIQRECPEFYIKCVKMMLTKMSLMMNVREGLKPEQINVIPTLLLGEFGNLRLNDIHLVCMGIVTGKYKVYERVDVQSFFDCIRQYDASDERIQAREDWNRRGKDVDKTIALPKELHDDFKNIGKKLISEKDFKMSHLKATEWNKQRDEKEQRDSE